MINLFKRKPLNSYFISYYDRTCNTGTEIIQAKTQSKAEVKFYKKYDDRIITKISLI